jgi:zinc protease
MKKTLLLPVLLITLMTCQTGEKTTDSNFHLEYKKFKLDNGLEVVLHVDRSDPVVSVVLAAHVGSAREKPGRTGFAHLFEHLLFLQSENLGKGGLDQLSARIGGAGANGFTSRDITTYYQTVPKDALEKMIWAEADKLGWFINTVTEPVLFNEISVVKNEKRQVVDNRPYGHTNYVIAKNLYPQGHPYSWTVIGSMADLQASTLEDVKEFYKRWYVPNNTTLVIAGDFDIQQTEEWVKKYFDEIPSGMEVNALNVEPVRLEKSKRLYHEDNFARLPELNLVWPTVKTIHNDYFPLVILSKYLSDGKKAPLYKKLVEDLKLTAGVNMNNYSTELEGEMSLTVRAFPDIELDSVLSAIQETFRMFESTGIPEADLQRIIAGMETDFYRDLSDVSGKSIRLAHDNILTGDPGYSEKRLEQLVSVSTDDVIRVYNTYIGGKDYVATSFVPLGETDLILEGSSRANVVEEDIEEAISETYDLSKEVPFEKTPSTFDRSQEPPYGEPIELTVPDVWEFIMENGIRVSGIENREVPLVYFTLHLEGGQLMESQNQAGISNLMAEMMNRGTRNRSPEELEDAIKQLGSTIRISSSQEEILATCVSLAKNYTSTMALLEEMLLEPRWDEAELKLVKKNVESQLVQQEGNPNAIASNKFNEILYGKDDTRSVNRLGTVETSGSLTGKDLEAFYERTFYPSLVRLNVIGAIDQESVKHSLESLNARWIKNNVHIPEPSDPVSNSMKSVFFYDVPGAKQSVIYLGYMALAETDEDFYPAVVMNYILGGGGFASRLTQDLRVEKGYTYGIRSGFFGSNYRGPFRISTSVQSKITLEAAQSIKEIVENYGTTYSETDLSTTKGYLIKSNARAFESARAKLHLLDVTSAYGWSPEFIKEREDIVKNMTVERIQELSRQYLDMNRMFWVVVGDANTQLERLRKLGAGDVVLLNQITNDPASTEP